MRPSIFQKAIHEDFVVIDSQFPQKNPFAFRNAEINDYFNTVKNFSSFTMHPTKPDAEAGFGHGYGVDYATFQKNKKGYCEYYPQNASRIHYLFENKKYKFGLSYSYFLAETYVLLPFYEKHKIPFTFVLYPGGLFGLNSKESDHMLKKILSSKYFRKVIVTQKITQEYLLNKKFCSKNQISFIYGGFVQFKKNEVKQRLYFGKDKPTLDICFVAAKYSEKGVDKGYDLFIEAAKKLAKASKNIKFHVVGGFDENEIDICEIKSQITFYGYKRPDFLLDFYTRMDIFLSPNRPFQLFNGNFDGFPLGIDAGYCGVALFVADELQMNHYYAPDKEMVILSLNAQQITKKVLQYYKDPGALRRLAQAGQVVTQALFDMDYQIDQRLKVFKQFIDLEPAKPNLKKVEEN